MNLSEFIEETRKYLDDDSASRVNEDELTIYINNAYYHYYNDLVNKNYPRFLTKVNLSVVDGYAQIPDNFYKAQTVYKVEGSDLIPLDYYVNYDMIETMSDGLTTAYTFEGNYFKFYGMSNCTLQLVYYPEITPLSLWNDEPVVGFLTSWQRMIPVYAAILLKGGREEEDVQGLAMILGKLEDTYNDYLTRMTNARSYIHPFIP